MNHQLPEKNRRIVVIDDNRAIHDDFRKILQPERDSGALARDEQELFGEAARPRHYIIFTVDSAHQGREGAELVRQAVAASQPYALAFVDMRMPPGWDGLETTVRLWEIDPDLQIVICTAYSDYAWPDLIAKIGQSDRLVILKKPFDNVEVLQLSLALTEKRHLLQQTRQQLEHLQQAVDARTGELQAEVAVRRQAESEAQAARLAAESASRSKSAFLANMSHEIRTPMNGILGMANLLLDSGLTDEQRSFVKTLHDSSESLLAVLNDILDFSKIEAGRMTLEDAEFELSEVVESSIELHAARALEKNLELITQIGGDVPTRLRGDAHRLRQVLLNLIGNALKFTDRGEIFLDVGVARQDDATAELRFEVHDTGVGIAAETLPRLFQPFSQADDSTTRRFGGTGLGLAICRRILDAMGGAITVRSQPGSGSTFSFTVPFAKQEAPADDRPPEPASLHGLRALIVDDNDTNRRVLRHLVGTWGIESEAARGGREALEAVRAAAAAPHPFDLVLLDMQMPEMDGLMLADAIQALQLAEPPRLVMLTSMTERLAADDVRRHGLDACLSKPLRHLQLFQCLTAVIGAHRRTGTAAGPVAPRSAPAAGTPADSTLFARGEPITVLVAEDDAVNQRVAILQLRKLGLSADVVADGSEVLPALRRKSYPLILMDCQMPGMDGFETTRLIRREEAAGRASWAAPVHIVAMTASAMQGDRESCLAAGMSDYVSKPATIAQLAAVLGRRLPGPAAPFDAVPVLAG